jgi:hypothetical protein
MPRWRAASGGLALALGACAAPHPATLAPAGPDPLREAALVRQTAVAFISEEARGESAADTLLAANADFIDSGVPVTARPRLSAVLGRGTSTVETVRTEVAGAFAWVVAVYRWRGPGGPEEERGRATMILERQGEAWKIRHVHSSSVPPWR